VRSARGKNLETKFLKRLRHGIKTAALTLRRRYRNQHGSLYRQSRFRRFFGLVKRQSERIRYSQNFAR
jgi:hypothetical protein